MANAPPRQRPMWLEYVSLIGTAAILMGVASYSGGVTQRLNEVEKQASELKARLDQQDKDKEATIDKLNAIDGRTIRIETTLTLLRPGKDKVP